MGSRQMVDQTEEIDELLEIDREIGKPYMKEPLIYSSQAWSRRLELPWVIKQVGQPDSMRILDVGSGFSALPIYFARHGAEVVSVDPVRLQELQRRSVTLVRGALPKLPFPDSSFDLVCCVSVLEHLDVDIPDSIAELCRVSRKMVLLTFDVALGPFATFGLSRLELKAFSKMTRKPLVVPADPLIPSISEKGAWAGHMSVCLLRLEKTNGVWPRMQLGGIQRGLVRLHRAWERFISFARYHYRRMQGRPS